MLSIAAIDLRKGGTVVVVVAAKPTRIVECDTIRFATIQLGLWCVSGPPVSAGAKGFSRLIAKKIIPDMVRFISVASE